jgi:hypothetical protein
MVSVVAIRAIRPIEAAQEESFEQLVGAKGDGDELALEDAIEAEARA